MLHAGKGRARVFYEAQLACAAILAAEPWEQYSLNPPQFILIFFASLTLILCRFKDSEAYEAALKKKPMKRTYLPKTRPNFLNTESFLH